MYFQQTSIGSHVLPVSLRASVYFAAAACLAMGGGLQQAWASTATTTALTMTSGGSAVTTVTSGSVVTLTATVMAGGTAVTPGQVNFCDATAKSCTDIHLLGTAQLTGNGMATLKFRPGIGSHSYNAVFAGTNNAAASASVSASLTVIGTGVPSATTFAPNGSQGTYTFTATVSGNTAVAPTGTVSFVDTSNANAVLGTAALTPGTAGLIFVSLPFFVDAPALVATGDFNGDGIADLVAISVQNSNVEILLGNGDGTFKDVGGFAAQANGVVVGDFNGDGKPDLATVSGSKVTIFLGNGDGTFTSGYQSPQTVAASAIAVGDFNGDGKLDLVVTTGSSGATATVLLGNGDGTFTIGATVPTGANPGPIAVGDFNRDGKLDLAIGNQNGDSVSILLGNGDGTFTAGATIATTAEPNALAVADFNADGKLDLAVQANGTVTILLGNGDGTFIDATPATGYSGTAVVVGDFNGDGIVDLAVAGTNDPILLGKGDGTFTTVISTEEVSDTGSIAVADFNGDGTWDLAGALFGGDRDTIEILISNGTSATATASNIEVNGLSPQIVAASYSGDNTYKGSVSGGIQLGALTPFSIGLTTVPPIMTGASASSTVTVTPTFNFTATLTIFCAVNSTQLTVPLPTCSMPSTVAVSGGTPVSITATISALPTTPAGAYLLQVSGFPDTGGYEIGSNLQFTVIAGPDFILGATPVILTSPGASGTSTLTITPSNGFTGIVSLTCAVTSSPVGAVDMPTCSATAPAAISGTASVTATLTIGTTAASSAAVHDPLRRTFTVGGGVAMAALFFLGMPVRRRRLKTLLGLLLFAAVAGAGIGCSSAANNTPTTPANPGTTPGSYTVTVTGASGATTVNTAVSVTIN